MRKSFIQLLTTFVFALLLTYTSTSAQILNHWGIKLGFNTLHTVGSNDGIQSQLKSRTGVALGGFVEAFDNGHFNLLTEIDFIQK
jgi:hypothetical protein